MKPTQRDFIAESIADYEAMNDAERGKMTLSLMEDQPVLMSFITELADDFSDAEHAALVDSVIVLIQAFIAAGIPLDMLSKQLVNEVIEEKAATLEEQDETYRIEQVDSPKVFIDLENWALFKAGLAQAEPLAKRNYALVLDTLITMVERSITQPAGNQNKDA